MALAHRRPYGVYRWLADAPRWFYRLGLGWLLGYRVMQLTHRGRKSGVLRRTILEVLHYDPQTPRGWWCPAGKGKRIGIATSSASRPWKCVLAGCITDQPRNSSRPKKQPRSSSPCFASTRGRSASSDDSWASIPRPRMLPCVFGSRPSFGEGGNALLLHSGKVTHAPLQEA